MQKIFEEYGQLILVIIVAIALLGTIFGGMQIFKLMGNGLDLNTNISHSKSEAALEKFSTGAKPTISVTNSDSLHLYVNQSFKPVASVVCADKDGNKLIPTVESIMYFDNDTGSQTEVLEYYDKEGDVLDIPSVIGRTGVLSVTYKVADSDNAMTTKAISYIIDTAQP